MEKIDKKNGSNQKKIIRSFFPKSLGPVLNLEEHVPVDWWRNIFNSYYLKTDADVIDDQEITFTEIDLFVKILNIDKEDYILDLCCGQGRHILELSRRKFKHLYGIDRSRYLIQRAKAFSKKEGVKIRFKEGDARKLPYEIDYFNYVMILGNSFGYFETSQDDIRVLKEVFRILEPHGKLLIDVTDGDFIKEQFQPRSWEWIDNKYFVCRERSLSSDKQRLISREVITHVGKGVIADQFYAERLYSKESIKDLLIKSGFSDIKFHGNIKPNSKRNQDLGMMEKRLIISALVKKDWTPVKTKKRSEIENITVLLGDPNKTDIIKPSNVFDDDDIYTINQLKSALKTNKEYNFTYLTNHDSLINDLVKSKAKIDFVFNLCDEGYNNDARKELHVPSILEVLDIPYSGSGPQCLAFCYDKSLIRGVAKEMDIPVPEAFFIKPEDTTFDINILFPVIVKPNYGDSSFGITQRSVAYNIENLSTAILEIREKLGYEKPIIVEEFLTGKDISVGIIGNPPESYTVLPIIEEDYSKLPKDLPKICGYEAKWIPNSPYWKNLKSIPAVLPEEIEKFVIDCCLKLFERLECRDYCRFDWRLDSNENPKLLEVNPNPGWCWDGHLAKMSKFSDISYSEMLKNILHAAENRLGIQGKQ